MKKFIFSILLIFISVSAIKAQIAPPADPICDYCKRKLMYICQNGGHAKDCPDYKTCFPPGSDDTQKKEVPATPGNDPLGTLNKAIDGMLTPTPKKPDAPDNYKAEKKATEDKLKNDATKDAALKNVQEKRKGLPDEKTKETSTLAAAKIKYCRGNNIRLKKNGIWTNTLDCSELQEQTLLFGDTIITGKGSVVQIILKEGVKIQISENTSFGYDEEDVVSIISGQTSFSVEKILNKLKRKCNMLVRTPAACCCVRGTKFITNVSETGITEVLLYEGELEIESNDLSKKVTLTPGKKLRFNADGKIDTIEKFDTSNMNVIWEE